MSGPAPGNRNLATALAVRELVAAHLSAEGFDAIARRHAGKLSEAAADALVPDVDGLPGTFVVVSSRRNPYRFWEDLATAENGAALTGRRRGVLIQWRSSQPIGQAFAVMSLDTLAGLLRSP